MSRDDIPEPWRSALERKGIDSIRGLASKAGISPNAASRLVKGGGTSAETVDAVAWFVFDNDVDYVWSLRGLKVKDRGRFDLPPEASLLSKDQRQAVVAVIRAMLPEDIRKAIRGDLVAQAHEAQERARLSPQDQAAFDELERAEEQAANRERHEPDVTDGEQEDRRGQVS